jgi:hypothetical protein
MSHSGGRVVVEDNQAGRYGEDAPYRQTEWKGIGHDGKAR